MNISAIIAAAPRYLYAGALRVGIDDAVEATLIGARKAGASEDTIEFLRTDFGQALVRLALAASFEVLPEATRPPKSLQSDLQQELLVSASAAGITAVQSVTLALGRGVVGRLREKGGSK
jgi:hypothetical protein